MSSSGEMVKIEMTNREIVDEFIMKQWYSTKMILRGKEIDMTKAEGFYVLENDTIIGLVTYIEYNNILEILSLDSLKENNGIGTGLFNAAVEEAMKRKCKKVVLITTNDNINAIKFYQKRGFDLTKLYHNALEKSRKLKPEIPLIGENGIPLRHELEFTRILQ